MKQEEIEALMSKVNKAVVDATKKASGENAEELKTLKTEVATLKQKATEAIEGSIDKSQFDTLKNEHINVMKQLKALQEDGKALKNQTLKGSILAGLEEKSEAVKSLKDAKGKVSIVSKAPVDISVANTIEAGATQYSLAYNTGIVSGIRKRESIYRNYVTNGTMSGNRAFWIEEYDEQGEPLFVAEGALKPQASVLYEEKDAKAKKVAVWTKITDEMLSDLPQLASRVQGNLMKRLDIKVEDNLFYGDGTGENLLGMDSYAVPFIAGSLAGQIDNANELDVLEAIALQVKIAYGDLGAIFVHPTAMSKMKLIKDTAGRPIWKDYITTDGIMRVSGLSIIETTALTDDDGFLGGDSTIMNVLDREGLNVILERTEDDLLKNKVTLLIERRLVQFASANDVNGLVKGTFTAAKDLIDAP